MMILLLVDHCADDPCKNGGTCESNADTYNCTCAEGYTGTTCEQRGQGGYSKPNPFPESVERGFVEVK